MKWLLDGAAIPSTGVVGGLRVHGLMALWLYALRAWEADESPDLSATMAAVDRGLDRAIQAENLLPGQHVGSTGAPMSPAEEAAAVFEAAGMTGDEAPGSSVSSVDMSNPGAPNPGVPGLDGDVRDLPPAPPRDSPESPIT